MVSAGDIGEVEVDAYPGEKFSGRIARVAPVLDPATRTATMEVEIPNSDNRLKPGMYARINLTVEERKNALVVPEERGHRLREQARRVDAERREPREVRAGASSASKAPTGSRSSTGLKEGDKFVTTGAAAVRNNDQLLIAGAGRSRRAGGGRGGAAAQGAAAQGGRQVRAAAAGQRPSAAPRRSQPRKRPQRQSTVADC